MRIILFLSVAICVIALPLWRTATDRAPHPAAVAPEMRALVEAGAHAVLPLIPLHPRGTHREADWSDALAEALHGRTEVRIAHGRVDVVSASYAIEVDWFDKWHEGLGQAQHYGLATGKAPAVALILKPDEWPLDERTLSKLAVIREVTNALGVEVFLLRLAPPRQAAMRWR